jgi:hypothetical protein
MEENSLMILRKNVKKYSCIYHLQNPLYYLVNSIINSRSNKQIKIMIYNFNKIMINSKSKFSKPSNSNNNKITILQLICKCIMMLEEVVSMENGN